MVSATSVGRGDMSVVTSLTARPAARTRVELPVFGQLHCATSAAAQARNRGRWAHHRSPEESLHLQAAQPPAQPAAALLLLLYQEARN